ncbi:PREDICTED: uncharacterized protein LOC105450305 [Wasmannia auropunctata]|uniref:uncharacterized protein LOC105450305 n=1 Tax=Wasmannia auropunctata TaxID=64793 RepID=UPI0005F0A523|nr:PREDICTED: uncharacterized protein LOC105450305 [Wasmannia auropunctata]
MGARIRRALERIEKEKEGDRKEGKGWWDKECREKKRQARRALRAWRGVGEGDQTYKREKKEYKELCERKKEEENGRWERKAEEARTEGQVWEIVNRERKKWKGINKDIGMDEWEEYFRNLLGGVESRVVKGEGRGGRMEEESVLGKEEIASVLGRIKKGKAMGVDGVPGEVWKYGEEEVKEWVWRMCNKIWRGEGWPEEWKEGVVVPIKKKGRGEVVEE